MSEDSAAAAAVVKRASPPKQRNPWPFMGAIVLLCIAGWYVVQWMSSTSSIQDCMMAGHKKCGEPIDPKLGR